jgi:hypothetical protein
MKGRGMAKPIAVLLIILIAIVAIGIIWVILQGFLREQSEISLAKQQLAQENIDIDDIEGDWSLGSFVNLTLRRGAQEKILINTTVIEKF